MTSDATFAIVTRDELWSHGALLSSRLTAGVAEPRGSIEGRTGQGGNAAAACSVLVARDTTDPALLAAADTALARLYDALGQALGAPREASLDFDLRLVAEAFRDGESEAAAATLTVRAGRISIVTDPEHCASDVELLRSILSVPVELHSATLPQLPLVWRNGTAAVLLHEAAGHASEERQEPLAWPRWLSVVDDAGASGVADLLAGEAPHAMRRHSFRDVPMHRMTRLIASHHGAPFELPDDRVEILLVSGGTYEPLTEEVRLQIAAADLVEGRASRRLAPFTITMSRASVARSLAGAAGEPQRFPGVVCSREGQELVVGSFAPDILSVFR